MEVFVGEDGEEGFGESRVTEGGGTVEECLDNCVVASAALVGHGGFVGVAYAVLASQAAVILLALLWSDGG